MLIISVPVYIPAPIETFNPKACDYNTPKIYSKIHMYRTSAPSNGGRRVSASATLISLRRSSTNEEIPIGET